MLESLSVLAKLKIRIQVKENALAVLTDDKYRLLDKIETANQGIQKDVKLLKAIENGLDALEIVTSGFHAHDLED
jgi:hypothetical protein